MAFVSLIISLIGLGKTETGKPSSSLSSDMQMFVSLDIVMSVHLPGSVPLQKRYLTLSGGG